MSTVAQRSTLESTLKEYYAFLSNAFSPGKPKITAQQLEKWCDPHIVFLRNAQPLCHDSSSLAHFLSEIQHRFSKVTFSNFVEPPLIDGNRACLFYSLVTHDIAGHPAGTRHIMAILTFKDHRIVRWSDIVNDVATIQTTKPI